jgi:hypothetical protein
VSALSFRLIVDSFAREKSQLHVAQRLSKFYQPFCFSPILISGHYVFGFSADYPKIPKCIRMAKEIQKGK